MRNFTIVILALILITSNAYAVNCTFNNNKLWRFSLGDNSNAKNIEFDDNGWRLINVPHDWSIEGEYSPENPMGDRCGYLPAGIGWYRKTVPVLDEWKNKYIELEFDGVFMNSTVWVNEVELGTVPYGWRSFAYDISNICNTSDSLTIAVRVDNDLQPAARWYTGSGIYGNTRISIKDKVNIPRDGVKITTDKNRVTVDLNVVNLSDNISDISIETSIDETKYRELTRKSIESNGTSAISVSFDLSDPNYWSPEDPNLYNLNLTLSSGGKVLHKQVERFGLRDIEWSKSSGLRLNGENIKIRGVCNHQDAGAFGTAVPEKIIRFRVKQLKEMGVNAIRTAHNPFTPEFYSICDEEGMLVLNEIFDGWSRKASNDYGSRFFKDHWREDLKASIDRDRNHPSIFAYSLGNETRGEVAVDMVELCHKLDPTRMVTSGSSESEVMDIYGENGHSERKSYFDNHAFNAPFIGTENPHTWQVRGYYRTKTWYRDGFPNLKQEPFEIVDLTKDEIFHDSWTYAEKMSSHKQVFNSSYDNATVRIPARAAIAQIRDIPQYSGNFRWTGYDYIGEAGYVHGGWPFKAFSGGAIDLANFEKDLYYLYKSQWTEEPMVHMLPHWTHPTIKEGTKIPVWVYSNCDKVELFLNGKSLGKQTPKSNWQNMQCEWLVGYTPGELKVVGYNKDSKVAEQIYFTASNPTQIELSIDGEPLSEIEDDVVQVRVTSADRMGNFYPYGENRTYFTVIGDGKIKALDNGNPIDTEPHFNINSRKAFYGLTRAYIESEGEGALSLVAASILAEKRQISSDEVAIDVKTKKLRGDLPDPSIKIYYSTDGTTPRNLYSDPFRVDLNSTIRAMVIINQQDTLHLNETVGYDEGYVFNDTTKLLTTGGEEAELATLVQADPATKRKGYSGKGYVVLGQNEDSSVEWYLENDGPTTEEIYYFRYMNPSEKQLEAIVTINSIEHLIKLPPCSRWENSVAVKATYRSGANMVEIKLTSPGLLLVDKLNR